MRNSPEFQVRRVYGEPRGDKSRRVLVDRLWPRGVTKAAAALDEWLKDVAPSAELRRWYGHDVARFDEFARRYRAELRRPPAAGALDRLLQLAGADPITLLTATRDVEHSGARVLQRHLANEGERLGNRRASSRRGTSRRARQTQGVDARRPERRATRRASQE